MLSVNDIVEFGSSSAVCKMTKERRQLNGQWVKDLSGYRPKLEGPSVEIDLLKGYYDIAVFHAGHVTLYKSYVQSITSNSVSNVPTRVPVQFVIDQHRLLHK